MQHSVLLLLLLLLASLPCAARIPPRPRRRARARTQAQTPCTAWRQSTPRTRRLVEAVRHRLKEDRRRGDALVVGLVPVAQVPAVREVEAHDAVVRVEQGGVDLRREWGWWGCVFLLFLAIV